MAKQNEILTMPLSAILSAIRSRELSSVEVTDAFLDRIEACDGEINAFISFERKRAQQSAQAADDRFSAGDGSVPMLNGLPAAVKDNIAVRGYRMTCASRMLEDFVPPYDAAVVASSGCVVLGKTNLDEFAMGSSCEKSIAGPTKNPLDPSRSPGGSSGGSAAAVAAYMAPFAIGTDTGGSCRQPAAFCGIVSMKPTYGLVSRYGVTEFASSMDTVCPMTRGVYDNALVLDALSGRDEKDMTSLDAPESFTDKIGGGVRGLRIGVMDSVDSRCESGAASSVCRAAKMLEKLGADVETVHLPDPDTVLDTYLVVAAAECSSNFARYDGLKYGLSAEGNTYAEIMANTRSRGFGDEVKRRILTGSCALSAVISGDRYRRVQIVRQTLCEQTDALFAHYDAVLMPTAASAAFGLAGFDQDPTAIYHTDCFTALANLTGHPALTLPCGGNGILPYGAMLMGRRLNDALLYRIAFALEAELKDTIEKEVRRIVL